MRIPLLLVAIGALASAATANSNYRRAVHVPDNQRSTFAFGHADKLTIERAELELHTDGTELRGSLRFTLSTWDEEDDDRSILIAVPAGTEVSELRITIDEDGYEGVIARPAIARAAYERTVEELKDPALLEWVSSSSQRTWLRLRVFPVTPRSPAKVALGFTLPRADSIAIDPGVYRIPNASITVDDRANTAEQLETRLVALVPTAPAMTSAPATRPAFVQRKKSLVAGPLVGNIDCTGEPACPEALVRDPILTYY